MTIGRHRTSLLHAVRVATAVAILLVVFPAVDTPGGYMGAHDEMTTFGVTYSIGLLAALAVAIWGEFENYTWTTSFTALLYSVNIGIFVPAVAADPVKATLVILWQSGALAVQFLETDRNVLETDRHPPLRAGRERDGRDEKLHDWYRAFGPSVRHALVGAIVLTLLVVGHGITDRWSAVAVCAVVQGSAFAALIPFFRNELRVGHWQSLLVFAPFAALFFVPLSVSAVLVAAAVTSPLILGLLVARSPLFREILEYFYDHPTLLILVAFASLIVLGVLLLTLPAASPGPESIPPIDALFTSTSATCVTGLIVLDTPHDFTVFGQAVILALIQIGGLGIMVLSTFALVALGRRLGVKGEQALDDLMETRGVRTAYRLTRFIAGTTFVIESIGAVVLTFGYRARGQPWGSAAWDGIFHAVSAFCNAGFALRSDSIVSFRHNPWMLATFAALIVVGGIGFVVLAALWSIWRDHQRPKFQTHASVVVVATVVLLVGGTILYGALEWNASLGPLPADEKIWNAIFQSVTLRTAGFNSVSFESLRSSTALFMMLFMVIGAAPGSTGGGVKVTTAAVLYGVVRAISSGRSEVIFFGRRIPDEIVYRSIGIVTLFTLAIVGAGTILRTNHGANDSNCRTTTSISSSPSSKHPSAAASGGSSGFCRCRWTGRTRSPLHTGSTPQIAADSAPSALVHHSRSPPDLPRNSRDADRIRTGSLPARSAVRTGLLARRATPGRVHPAAQSVGPRCSRQIPTARTRSPNLRDPLSVSGLDSAPSRPGTHGSARIANHVVHALHAGPPGARPSSPRRTHDTALSGPRHGKRRHDRGTRRFNSGKWRQHDRQ